MAINPARVTPDESARDVIPMANSLWILSTCWKYSTTLYDTGLLVGFTVSCLTLSIQNQLLLDNRNDTPRNFNHVMYE